MITSPARFSYCLFFLLAALALFTASCAGSGAGDPPPADPAADSLPAVQAEPLVARATAARRMAFPLRTLASGALHAARQVELALPAGGVLVELPLNEGDYVAAGALLAHLDDTDLRFRLRQARLQLDDARINKADLLLAQGGRAGVDSSVSAEKLALIHTLSGYDKAVLAVEQAEQELARARLQAPFAGLVANLKAKRYQQVGAGQTLCTLIDPASFEVRFQLLEREALRVRPGQTVRVRPAALPDREWTAAVSAVNPVVSEQGLVTLHARLQGDTRRLFEGMNVDVAIEQAVPDQVVIPKSAVVLRSGREVVFTYDPASGLAKWHYVTVAYENDRAVAVGEGLQPGDLVIYEGNLNLDHDAEVQVEVDETGKINENK